MKLSIINNVTKKNYDFNVTDKEDSVLFYHFDLTLDGNIDDGDYEYILFDSEDNVVANGLMRIGNYEIPSGSTATYNNNSTEFIQYNG